MILVTGHEPPEEFDANPSATLARRLEGESVGGHRIAASVLPNDPATAASGVVDAIQQLEPDVVLAAGFLPGSTNVVVERLGFAAGDFLGAAEGSDEPEGPVGYVSTMPNGSVVEHLGDRDIPSMLSIATASPLSDRVLFEALEHVTSTDRPPTVGSMGFPCTPEQAVRRGERTRGDIPPSMSAELQLEALLVAVKLALQERE
jgi:pyroglutamyl-peptidase